MKTRINNLFLLPALFASLGLMPTGRVTAQTFTIIHRFTNNNGGANPYGALILSGNTLYGTTKAGGSSGLGIVYRVNPDDTGFTNLHSFSNNIDGFYPYGGLVLSGNTLYGTVNTGGTSGKGAVFAVNTDGTGFTNLHGFTAVNYLSQNLDGATPYAGLILSDNALYGTTWSGGTAGGGAVFKLNPDGTGFTNLHSFEYYADGGALYGGLGSSGSILYGTANLANLGSGKVFKISTTGTGFTNLYHFTALTSNTNSDGANPYGALVLAGSTLYGTTRNGGTAGEGAVFKVNTDGSGFTNLHSFTARSGVSGTNSEGARPYSGLVLSGNILYGTAYYGGTSGVGSVYAVRTDGTGFTNLHNFTNGSDGGGPHAGLMLSGNTLYGAAGGGGGVGYYGTLFKISLPLPPQLTIIPSGANVILTWPTNDAGFTLQSTTNIVSPAAWTNVVPGPVVVNEQNTVTNPISGAQQFYRLSQ